MSSLSSASSNAQVWAAFDDNASFEEDGSPTKAAAFVTACLILLRRRPSSATTDGVAVSFDSGAIETELQRARSWLRSQSANGDSIRYLDFSGVRD